ncbi:NEMP family [Popillia japonica]|uniref:NEMP family n=1 Tax=Popillia japonica TaxID=7064 RepID=A0AAW1LAT0_POPJA
MLFSSLNFLFKFTVIAEILSLVLTDNVYYMHPDRPPVVYDPVFRPSAEDSLQIFCYEGKPKYVIYLWQSVSLQIDLPSDNYVQYDGYTPEDVKKEYLAHRRSWSLNLFAWKQKHFKLNPFNKSCIGIDSNEKYTVYLNVIRIDYWKICSLILGIILFISGSKLSQNTFFYYLSGVLFGICASFLILIYFISKLLPKKPLMYGALVGGWTVGVYILQILFENMRLIMTSYQSYVTWYAIITGFISFLVCYRLGPVTNKRTQNIIQWTIQFFGLVLIFRSSQFQEAAMGQIVILVIVYNFPKSWVSKSRTYWKRKFPPKIKLLTNDEYYEQGVRHTAKALNELRVYCSSPNCNQWKTALKLQDVKRFASFIEGSSHLSDDEILEYETSLHNTELTDDEDENALTDEEY